MNINIQKTKATLFIFLVTIMMSTATVFGQNTETLSFDELFEKGKEHYEKEEYSTSLNYFQQAAIIKLNRSSLATYLGITCKELNLYGSAIAYFENALNIRESTTSLGNLGAIYGDLGQNDISLKYLDEALDLNPYYAYALSNKASTFITLGKYDEALRLYNEAIENSETPMVANFSGIGEIYQEMGQSEKAILYFDKAIDIDSTYTEAKLLKVKELKALGKTIKDYKPICEQVIKMETERLAKNPQAYKSLFFRASAYQFLSEEGLMSEDLYKAYEILDNLTNLYPKASSLFEWKARIDVKLGDIESAVENYKTVLNLEPENISAKEYLEKNKDFQAEQLMVATEETAYIEPVYEPYMALDSLRSLPGRIELPDSIDKESMKPLLGPIILKKLKLENDTVVFDAVKEDITNIGLPDVVYYFFLQEISDYNFRNKIYKKSSEQIQEDFQDILSEIRKEIKAIELKNKKNELLNNNVELLNYFEEKENNKDITPKEVENLIFAYRLVSDKLELVDGKITADIPENKELDNFTKKSLEYLQLMIEFTNLDFEINDSSLEEREEMKEWLKRDLKSIGTYNYE